MDRPDSKKRRLFAEWIEMGVALLTVEDFPSMKIGEKVAKRAIARAALHATKGKVGKAANLAKTSRRTLQRAANDNSILANGDIWHSIGMSGPFDDALFPFLRVMWPHDAGAEFVNDLLAWWTSDVVPRAAAEATHVIAVHNFSAFSSGLPPAAVVSAMLAHKDEFLTQVAPILLSIIIFSPHVPLAAFLEPVINICPFETKLATTPGKVISLAETQFQKAGVQTPSLVLA